ncbi:MAG: VOC family protein [Steroidobacteraceae bacterium]
MRATPAGWPRISVSVFYEDPARAIDWLVAAFGFEVRLRIEGEGGAIVHSELTFGEGLMFVGGAGAANLHPERAFPASPRAVGERNTQAMCIFVDDVDAHCTHAREAGARIEMEPTTNDYGDDYWTDRSYLAVDPEGHRWWFMQRLKGAAQ